MLGKWQERGLNPGLSNPAARPPVFPAWSTCLQEEEEERVAGTWAEWEGREAPLSWGLGAKQFLELSFLSVSSKQVKNPTEGPSLIPHPLPTSSSQLPLPPRWEGGGQVCRWGCRGERSEEVGVHHSGCFPSSTPLPHQRRSGRLELSRWREWREGCGLRLWRRRGKPVSQAGTEVWGPLGLLSEEELA